MLAGFSRSIPFNGVLSEAAQLCEAFLRYMLSTSCAILQMRQALQAQQPESSRGRPQDDRRDGSKPVPKWMKLGKK